MTMRTGAGLEVTPAERIGAGGEGEVFAVAAPTSVVFKRFRPVAFRREPLLAERLRVMVAQPPDGWLEAPGGHVTMAWPADVVYDGDNFAGFLMPYLELSDTVELHRVTNPTDRRSAVGSTDWIHSFSWRYAVRAAANLAQATWTLHDADVVIGDFNERNIRVTRDARVTLLDCDSMQVSDRVTGARYLCRVGRPEFTAPELLHADWKTTVRNPSSDLFALAIHVYQILLEGEHPFRGVWQGSGDKPSVTDLAPQGMWAYRDGGMLRPRPSAISIEILPRAIRKMFQSAFELGALDPDARPSAEDWHEALAALDREIAQCGQDSSHTFWSGLEKCPWCAHAADEWGRRLKATQRRQVPLEALVSSYVDAEPPATDSPTLEEVVPPREHVVERKIELGRPTRLPITRSEIENIPELYNAVSDGDRWEFCLLRITPTFHDEKRYNFAEARARVTLETPGQEWPDSETPKAWWMEPGSVVGQVHRTRDFKLSSSALHVGPNLTFGSNYDKDEPFILAYNIQCPSAYWKFTRTRSRAIRGSHKLTMVVRMPKGCHTQAVIEISGTVVKHFRVGARRHNDVGDDPCRILLSEGGVKQAKIDFITGNDD